MEPFLNRFHFCVTNTMNRVVIVALLLIGIFGAIWYANDGDKIKIDELVSKFKWESTAVADEEGYTDVSLRSGSTGNRGLRIATFNLDQIDIQRLGRPHFLNRMAEIFEQFDLIAVQGIKTNQPQLLPTLLDEIRKSGKEYGFAISQHRPRGNQQLELAYVYNKQYLETTRQSVFSLDDPDNLFRRDPLIGSFRVRGPDPKTAFTFTLVNIHVDEENAKDEVDLLEQVYRIVRTNSAGEDDIILLGDFYGGDRELRRLSRKSNLEWVISNQPTSTNGEFQQENIIFYRPATVEVTGRSGIYDFLKEQNLSMDEALELSGHLPVWAEFAPIEGGSAF